MVIPTATHSNKPISDPTAPEKTASFSFTWASNDNENLSANDSNGVNEEKYGQTRANNAAVPPAPVYIPAKTASGRKKRSGWCLAATFGAGVLVGLIIVALTVVFVHVFSEGKKSKFSFLFLFRLTGFSIVFLKRKDNRDAFLAKL